MQHILDSLISTLEDGQTAVLGAITRNAGSAPRTTGARMLILQDGTLQGTIGGGALEGACQAKAKELFAAPQPTVEMNFNLNAASAADAGMLCGGTVTVLLHRVTPENLPLFKALNNSYTHGRRPWLLTYLPSTDLAMHLQYVDGQEDNGIDKELKAEILRKTRRAPFLVNHDGREIFVEPLIHPGMVHLVGAGHVALACARVASYAGFEIVVMDDRRDFANLTRFPDAREIRVLKSFDDCIHRLGADDYVIIVTRGHMHDREVLAQALRTKAGYVGMIGSRRKREAVFSALLREGFTETDLARVHCPIGLSIGADTPEEIAISIVAELVQVRAGSAA
jgi:xanthine dehydrogenase accessory factor